APRSAPHDAERRCLRPRTRDPLDRRGPAVLAQVLPVDRVVQVMVCILERDVDLEAAGGDATCVVRLHPAEPSSFVAVDGSDVDVIPSTDHPDDPRALYRAVVAKGGHGELVRSRDCSELLIG